MDALEAGNIKISVTPVYKVDPGMLSRDGVTLTSEAISPYLDFLAGKIEDSIQRFESRRCPQPVVTLDDSSSESAVVPTTPAGQGFDSSLTLPEQYSTPQAPRDPSGAKSGVRGWCPMPIIFYFNCVFFHFLALLCGCGWPFSTP